MPMTTWEDIKGHDCVDCGGPATHFYHWGPICCECHQEWANSLPPSPATGPVDNTPLDEPILSEELWKALEDL